jgi:2-polyprenyl-3-methyl-5-hydroxy-6-metoxy-1,4-benzoquinol methylase
MRATVHDLIRLAYRAIVATRYCDPAHEGHMEPVRTLKSAARRAYEIGGRAYLASVQRREARLSAYGEREINEGTAQYPFALSALRDYAAHDVLDVGTGLSSWPRLLADCGFHVTAVDEFSNYWGSRPFNRHFLVQRDDITQSRLEREFDALTCLNVMMAVVNYRDAIAGMFRLVRPGGLIVLSFPYNELKPVENIYAHVDAGYGQNFRFPCRVYSRADIDRWLSENPAECVAQEHYLMFTGEFWTTGNRVPQREVSADEPHQFTAVAVRKRL